MLQGKVSMGYLLLLFELLKPAEHWAKNLYVPAKTSTVKNLYPHGRITR